MSQPRDRGTGDSTVPSASPRSLCPLPPEPPFTVSVFPGNAWTGTEASKASGIPERVPGKEGRGMVVLEEVGRQEEASPTAPAALSCISDPSAWAAGVTQNGTGAGMGSGGTEDAEPRLGLAMSLQPSASPWCAVLAHVASVPMACLEGRALLCGFMPQVLADFGAHRSQGVVSGSPARCSVGPLQF